MNKQQIFRLLDETFLKIGEISKFNVERSTNKSLVSGFNSASFNYIKFFALNDNIPETLKKSGIPFICFANDDVQPSMQEFAERHGMFKACDVEARIYEGLEHWIYEPASAVEVREISTDDELKHFDLITSVAFSCPEGMTFRFLRNALSSKDFHLYLAYVDGKPVGACMMSAENGVAGLYWGGVLPEFRGQGVATEMAKYRMNHAKQLGCYAACVQNMPASVGLYKRLGFEFKGSSPLYMHGGKIS